MDRNDYYECMYCGEVHETKAELPPCLPDYKEMCTFRTVAKKTIEGCPMSLKITAVQNDNEDMDVEIEMWQDNEHQQTFRGTIPVVMQAGS